MGFEALEGVADEVLSSTGMDCGPVDAFLLAHLCGCVVRFGRGPSRLNGNVITVDAMASSARQQGSVAHELAHFLQLRAAEPNTEEGARYLSGALMLPRRRFDRDLRETEWHLGELRARHPNASLEMIGRRIATMRSAAVGIWDRGRLTRTVGQPSELAHEAARTAFEERRLVRFGQTEWAAPTTGGPWTRVLTIECAIS